MTTPTEQHATAAQELDTLSLVITRGGPISPDLTLRLVTAARNRLHRHRPEQADRFTHRCAYDGQTWPCADVTDDLAVFAPADGDD